MFCWFFPLKNKIKVKKLKQNNILTKMKLSPFPNYFKFIVVRQIISKISSDGSDYPHIIEIALFKNNHYIYINTKMSVCLFVRVLSTISYPIPRWLPKIQDGRHKIQFFDIFPSWFLESDGTQRTKKNKLNWNFLNLKKQKSGQSNNFWVSYGPLKYVYKW